MERVEAGSASAPRWRAYDAIAVLSVIGIGISGYLTYVKLTNTAAVCAGIGNCELVQSSVYSEILGIPIAILGLLSYAGMLALWAWGRSETWPHADYALPLLFGLALFALLYSAYLTYLELFVLHAICPWCVASAICVLLIFGLATRRLFTGAEDVG